MLMEKERQEIVDYGKKMSSAGLSKGTSGNISAYDPVCGYMAISPSGLDYFETAAEDIVILDLNGNLIEGSRKPSSEHALHATIYKLHPDARGVVHAHSTYCTTFACLKQPIEAVHYLLAGAQTSCVPNGGRTGDAAGKSWYGGLWPLFIKSLQRCGKRGMGCGNSMAYHVCWKTGGPE